MKILFILPALTDSYSRKRIDMTANLGIECTIYGYDRDHYEGKPWGLPTTSLGRLTHARLFSRIPTMVKSIFKIRKAVQTHDVLYCFNFDILFIGWLSTWIQNRDVKIVYDVADIHNLLGRKGTVSSVLRALERFLLKRTSLVVVASPAYIDGYFRDVQKADNKFFPIENKMMPNDERQEISAIPHENGLLKIGYFGMIRCEQSLQLLKQLVKNSEGRIQLILRGIFLQTEKYIPVFDALENATYGGPFIYPDDLESMYNSVDLVWAAHMHGTTNSQWSVSNRFYQACFFHRPLIGQINTQDSKKIDRYQIGCSIDLHDLEGSKKIIQSINDRQIEQWTKNLNQVPEEVYTFTNEHKQLVTLMESVIDEQAN